MHIRAFAVVDTDEVVSLWERCGLTRPWNDPRLDIARKLTVQPELFLVAEHEGVIVGTVMAGFDGHRGWVNYVAVEPERQRAGVGRELMTAVERLLETLGCPKLNLQVRAENESALGFYRALGYQPDAVVSLGKRLIPDEH